MSRHPKRHLANRPAQWATWQGRLVWAIDRAVSAFPSIGAASLKWNLPRSQLNTWKTRLANGGDVHFSTVLFLQAHLHVSIDWLAFGHGWPTDEVARTHGGYLRSVPPKADDDDENDD